jgi:hypothetical protein
LTNARPEVADYPYSTVIPLPGMMAFEDVNIQLIDLPPLTRQYSESWMYNIIRQADLCLLVLDGSQKVQDLIGCVGEIVLILEERHIRVVRQREDNDDEMRVREVPCRIVLTRNDLGNLEDKAEELRQIFPVIATSAVDQTGLDDLREQVFDSLKLVRIYTKLPGQAPDMTQPYVLSEGSTVIDAVQLVHREFVDRVKYVRVWGSGRFDGQQVPSDHVLADKDVIEIHLS